MRKPGRKVFDKMNPTLRNVIAWNSMIGAYMQHGEARMALKVFQEMDIQPNQVTFVSILPACSDLTLLDEGRKIHARIGSDECMSNGAVCSALINMYGKCGSIKDAWHLFCGLQQKDLVSWTAMISALAQNGHDKEALSLFQTMDLEGVKLEQATYIAILAACSTTASGTAMHRRILEEGFPGDVVVGTALVKMYGKHGMVDKAKAVFDGINQKDCFAWTSMMEVYSEHDRANETTGLFRAMELEGLQPTEVTFISMLEGCSQLATVKSVHAQIDEAGLQRRACLATSLVNAHSRCGSLTDASSAFEMASEKDTVSWNAIIGAYARHKLGHQTFQLFRLMDLEGALPDDVTFIGLLDACSSLNDVTQVKLAHSYIIRCGLQQELNVDNALISAYSGCGKFDLGRAVFNNMPRKDTVSWSAMIAAYAQHGQHKEAFELLEEMQLEGVIPEEIIFLIVLFSASHAGLVEKAVQLFRLLVGDCRITPRLEHYACVIDALARSGWLSYAEELIDTMPFKAEGVQWTTLLGWCKLHSDPERGTRAAHELFKLEPRNSSPYTLLSSTYRLQVVE